MKLLMFVGETEWPGLLGMLTPRRLTHKSVNKLMVMACGSEGMLHQLHY